MKALFILLYVFYVCVCDSVLLCSFGCPGTLTTWLRLDSNSQSPAWLCLQVLGLKVCAPTPSLVLRFKLWWYFEIYKDVKLLKHRLQFCTTSHVPATRQLSHWKTDFCLLEASVHVYKWNYPGNKICFVWGEDGCGQMPKLASFSVCLECYSVWLGKTLHTWHLGC